LGVGNQITEGSILFKREKITGGLRGLHNDELSDLRGDRRGGACDTD